MPVQRWPYGVLVETPGDLALTWRPLTAADLPLLTEWLREPLVARWWNHDTTAEAVQRDFDPSVRGEEPGEDLIVFVTANPSGCCSVRQFGNTPRTSPSSRRLSTCRTGPSNSIISSGMPPGAVAGSAQA